MSLRYSSQTLMIDADDTLWQNIIYFEAAMDDYLALVSHPTMSLPQLRTAFDELESKRITTHGYGSNAFHNSMVVGFEQLTGTACDETQAQRIAALADQIRTAEIELLPGVADTLQELSRRHRLILVTKGNYQEQTNKLERSGLAPLFHHVEVLHEKHSDAYQQVIARHTCTPQDTWMIGNSPRSDINPALQAGLHAVFVPHSSTWSLEHEDLDEPPHGQHLMRLGSFADLAEHF